MKWMEGDMEIYVHLFFRPRYIDIFYQIYISEQEHLWLTWFNFTPGMIK